MPHLELITISLLRRYSPNNSDGGGLAADTKNRITLEKGFCFLSLDEVDNGTDDVAALLNSITKHPYFRYFKVNLEKECPYWVADGSCTCDSNGCQICTCDDNGIPESLRYPYDMSDLNRVDPQKPSHGRGHRGIDSEGTPSNTDKDASYVDLLKNPEANTGFSGPKAARVWRAIYDNCDVAENSESDMGTLAKSRERLLLRRLLSGLHTSVTLHVAAFFYNDTKGDSPLRGLGVLNNPNISFYPNCVMFNRVAKNDEFIGNLYVLYQFVLRAILKAKGVFLGNAALLNSGSGGMGTDGDRRLHEDFEKLFGSMLFSTTMFDEKSFFESPGAHLLVPQMKRIMENVTTLMDCVTCEKCRVWGKLEAAGLAAALKIVLQTSDDVLDLSRGEKVTLVNLARQLAISVKNIHALAGVCKGLDDTTGG